MKARGLLLETSHVKPSNQPENPARESSDIVVPAVVREPFSKEKVILPMQMEENLSQASDAQIIDKTVTEEELMTDKSDSWFEEEIDETAQGIGKTDTSRVGQLEVDVSFSDLEEDDDGDFLIKMKKTATNQNNDGTGPSPGSNKSSEWLEVDDIVVD
jgi:hypothetical protein